VAPREAAHVRLVDHHLVPGHARRAVVAPGEGGLDDLAARQVGGAVAAVEGEVALAVADAVAEERVVPAQRADDVARVGVEQQLVGIEAQALARAVGPVHAVAVELAGSRLRQVAWKTWSVRSRRSMRWISCRPLASNRHSSTALGVFGEEGENRLPRS
jgi:hypothetical protein